MTWEDVIKNMQLPCRKCGKMLNIPDYLKDAYSNKERTQNPLCKQCALKYGSFDNKEDPFRM